MGFSEKTLGTYLASKAFTKPPMLWNLLFKEINEFCQECENDRMMCVLSPSCPERILLQVRIDAGATSEELPKFCYTQQLNNLKRFLQKRTTLYVPVDVPLFNKDFIELLFTRLTSKIMKSTPENLHEVHQIILNSKVPAIRINITDDKDSMFWKLLSRDKMIKEGSFLYDIVGPNLLVWHDGAFFISNFENGITMCNIQEHFLNDMGVLRFITNFLAAEFHLNVDCQFDTGDENQILTEFKMPFSHISMARMESESAYFQDFISYLQEYYPAVHFTGTQATDEFFRISLEYNNLLNYMERKGVSSLSYQALRSVFEKVAGLRTENTKENV